jgi:hypothetical protein
MPTASITASGPATGGQLADALARRRRRPSRSIRLDAPAAARSSRSGTRSTPMTRTPRCSAIRAAMSPMGPSPSTATVSPSGRPRRPPPGSRSAARRRGRRSGRRAGLGHLDVGAVGVGHPQVLGLRAGHLPVELRVAEQRSAHALVAGLRGLALGLQAVLAHEAATAGDLEGDDHPVAGRELADVAADGLDDAHRLVPEDVARVEERRHAPRRGAGRSRRGRWR